MARAAGSEWLNPADGSAMIRIPGGVFTMGADEDRFDEHPAHRVSLSPYSIGKNPVTWGQYRRFCRETGWPAPELPRWPLPGAPGWGQYCERSVGRRPLVTGQPFWQPGDDHPVVNVCWEDAQAYCRWASGRLPTEAEWELAARGFDERKNPWGNRPTDSTLANFASRGTTAVGSYPLGRSPLGCLDMAGNVWEWCADWYGEHYYENSPSKDPQGPENGCARVLRGGGWYYYDIGVHIHFRGVGNPRNQCDTVGFRVAL
ncbi:MAG: SUMF1/EgtB/PvdO family nonheme iron enzyme [Candidatus Wallbacteria bacterium]|nr:SUMF1/EgtB/PvdO family nonheme iron enzyme [Candidatus Wallbacteria bacterium]